MRLYLQEIYKFIKGKKGKLWSVFCLFIIYGLLKSVVYFAPLFFNRMVNNLFVFGRFEYALNLGQNFSSIMALGLPTAYAYFFFKKKESRLQPLFHLVFIYLSGLLLVIAIIPGVFGTMYFSSFVVGIAFANQLLITTYYKLSGKNILSVVIECGIYILLLLLSLAIYFKLLIFDFYLWNLIITLYILILNFVYHIKKAFLYRGINKHDWLIVLKYGISIVITGLLTSFLKTSTRIYIEFFNSFLDVGVYSFYIRVASIIIIFHRVVVIFLYRNIYMAAHSILDRYFAIVLSFALVCSFLIYLIVPEMISVHFNKHDGKLLFLLTLFQVLSWASVTLFELIIFRENLLKKYTFIILICLIGMLFFMLVFNGFLHFGLVVLLIINIFFIFLLPFFQFFLLKSNCVYYKNTFVVHLLITCLFLISTISYFLTL